MKYRYSRFKSGILYCALQKKYLPAGAENFRARSGPQGAGVAKTWGSLIAQFEGPFCEILTKKSQKKIRNLVHKSPLARHTGRQGREDISMWAVLIQYYTRIVLPTAHSPHSALILPYSRIVVQRRTTVLSPGKSYGKAECNRCCQ
jgi:hypothetical protein